MQWSRKVLYVLSRLFCSHIARVFWPRCARRPWPLPLVWICYRTAWHSSSGSALRRFSGIPCRIVRFVRSNKRSRRSTTTVEWEMKRNKRCRYWISSLCHFSNRYFVVCQRPTHIEHFQSVFRTDADRIMNTSENCQKITLTLREEVLIE